MSAGLSVEIPQDTPHSKKYPGASIVAAPGVILSNALDCVLIKKIFQGLTVAGVVHKNISLSADTEIS